MRAFLACLCLLFAACQAAATAPPPAPVTGPFDWTLGDWRGVRRDGTDGSTAPIRVRVLPVLDGAGQVEELEVRHAGGAYRGFHAQLFDPELGRWVRQYANSARGRFVRLEGTPEGERCVWSVVSPERALESRLVSERPSPGRWTRTMHVSEDGGATWRVLWKDELARVP